MIYLSYDSGNPMENQASFRMNLLCFHDMDQNRNQRICKDLEKDCF